MYTACGKGLVKTVEGLKYFAVGVIQNRDSIFSFLLESIGINDDSHIIPVSEEWNLIVVNRWNEIPEDFSMFFHIVFILWVRLGEIYEF